MVTVVVNMMIGYSKLFGQIGIEILIVAFFTAVENG